MITNQSTGNWGPHTYWAEVFSITGAAVEIYDVHKIYRSWIEDIVRFIYNNGHGYIIGSDDDLLLD